MRLRETEKGIDRGKERDSLIEIGKERVCSGDFLTVPRLIKICSI